MGKTQKKDGGSHRLCSPRPPCQVGRDNALSPLNQLLMIPSQNIDVRHWIRHFTQTGSGHTSFVRNTQRKKTSFRADPSANVDEIVWGAGAGSVNWGSWEPDSPSPPPSPPGPPAPPAPPSPPMIPAKCTVYSSVTKTIKTNDTTFSGQLPKVLLRSTKRSSRF